MLPWGRVTSVPRSLARISPAIPPNRQEGRDCPGRLGKTESQECLVSICNAITTCLQNNPSSVQPALLKPSTLSEVQWGIFNNKEENIWMTVHACTQKAHQKFCNFKMHSDYKWAFLTYAKCELHKTFQNKTCISRVCLGIINGDHSVHTLSIMLFFFFLTILC